MCNTQQTQLSIVLTDFAVKKVRFFVRNHDKKNTLNLKLRIYIVGGGCGGFRYCFMLDDRVSVDDCIVKDNDIFVVVDPMSLQYLSGAIIDYYEGLEGSKFVVINPNARTTCSCGASFSI